MLMSFVGYTQYPIKTIFKGDSVIILTIEQSDKINQLIEKNSKSVKELTKKYKEHEEELRRLNKLLVEQNCVIDSLYNLLLEYRKKENAQNALVDSVWIWSLGPSLIYTEYPDDSTVYIMDLSQYYMTTDDFGIVMVKMSDREYKEYQEFIKTYGMSARALWDFRSKMRIKPYIIEEEDKKRVWKFRRDWDKYKKTEEK
jgi:hypothetical protein